MVFPGPPTPGLVQVVSRTPGSSLGDLAEVLRFLQVVMRSFAVQHPDLLSHGRRVVVAGGAGGGREEEETRKGVRSDDEGM